MKKKEVEGEKGESPAGGLLWSQQQLIK
jgi:hypothetical protein